MELSLSWNHSLSSVPECLEVTHVNLNDNTIEGIAYKGKPVFTVQFHPEAAGGPKDTAYLFDKFMEFMSKRKEVR